MAKYHQGLFVCKNPMKYVGNCNKIIYRSSWERKFMVWADQNPQVTLWGSEEIVIPYFSPVDNKMHRYFPDFIMKIVDNAGIVTDYIVEIKPHNQTIPPTGTKKTQRLLQETITYAINNSKWAAADKFCKEHSLSFIILTEHHLNV